VLLAAARAVTPRHPCRRSDTHDIGTEVVVIGAGQSGLAAARSLLARGISPVVLEAGPEPSGSWPHYYDSLTLFSTVAYSSMPGLTFPGHPDHYPHRDEVAAYLRRYAAGLDADIRANTPVTAVEAHGQDRFLVRTAAGEAVHARGVVAATGSFGHPHTPALPGQDHFTGRLLHAAGYAMETGQLDRRPMFTAFSTDGVVWPDGTREPADTVLFATGYRPHLDYLRPLGTLDGGQPRHSGGISDTHPGLVYLGLEFQRSFSSNTLRGVHRDAEHVIPPLVAHVRNARAVIGL
jgi:cation diffusion facilitator CzcD-associated flavoprotein CzcO